MRIFDFFFAIVLLILLSPVFIVIAIAITMDSRGTVFFHQERVGKNEKLFRLHKFRSMRSVNSDNLQLTVGMDQRITKVGRFIRKFKLDELPQLWNILVGNMSFIGPRPEVPKYVRYYTDSQKELLKFRPGLSDPASLAFSNEAELLAKQENPEQYYIRELMPAKLKMSLDYHQNRNFWTDLKIVLKTIKQILGL